MQIKEKCTKKENRAAVIKTSSSYCSFFTALFSGLSGAKPEPKLVPQRPLVYIVSGEAPLLCVECKTNVNLHYRVLSAQWSWSTTVQSLRLQIMKNVPGSWWTTFTKYDREVWDFILLRSFLWGQFQFLDSSYKVFLPVDSSCVTFLYLLNTQSKKIQDLYSLVLHPDAEWWNNHCRIYSSPKAAPKVQRQQNPMGAQVCVSHVSVPHSQILTYSLSVSRLIANTELCMLEWCLPPQKSVLLRVNLWFMEVYQLL